jgi:hypothetical protein
MPNDWSPTIDCAEEVGTAIEDYDDELGLMTARVVLRCAYADRHLLVASICGARLQWPKGAAGVVPRAGQASIVPVVTPNPAGATSTDEVITYGQALVTITYSTKNEEDVTEEIEPQAEFLTLDHRRFRWGPHNVSNPPAPLREEEAPGYIVRGLNLVRTERDVSNPIHEDHYDLIGYVNEDPYVSSLLTRTFDAETLLFQPPTIHYKKDSSGQEKWDLTKKWSIKPQGWNTFFRAATNSWAHIYVAGSTEIYKPYVPGDFSNLF